MRVGVDGRKIPRATEYGPLKSFDHARSLGQEESLKLVERAGLESHLHDPGWGKLRAEPDTPVIVPS
jgi:hypothetical protein